jgi:hypothetical protein
MLREFQSCGLYRKRNKTADSLSNELFVAEFTTLLKVSMEQRFPAPSGDRVDALVSRRIYIGDEDTVKSLPSVRKLPLDARLIERIRALGEGKEWVFRSEAGTPINPGNALKRYVRPAAKSLGIVFGGWHDFSPHPLDDSSSFRGPSESRVRHPGTQKSELGDGRLRQN